MIKLDCKYRFDRENYVKTWQASILSLVYYGSHLEVVVQTYEPFSVVVGKTSTGYFVWFKSQYTGVDLSSLFDIERNVPILSSVCFEEQKAATVAFAIKRVGNLLASQRRKKKYSKHRENDLPFSNYF